MTHHSPFSFLNALAQKAIEAAKVENLSAFLPLPPKGRTVVIGAGKAAASMAASFEKAYKGDFEGVVVTRYRHEVPTKHIKVLSAAHPVPDENSVLGAKALFKAVEGLTKDDLVIALISGGGSSLVTYPSEGLTLEDLRDVNQQLLASGADIGAMNCLRKRLSKISGGRLAAACAPAKLVTLAISDVPNDDPCVIASGATVLDNTTFEEAMVVIQKYDLKLSPKILAAMQDTPKNLEANEFHLIATPMKSLKAAKALSDIPTLILSDMLEGEAREVARLHGQMVKSILTHGEPLPTPCLIISGGETTVTLKGKGRGGRNCEFLLSLAIELSTLPLEHRQRVSAIAIDTDGIDGVEDAAGAYLSSSFDKDCIAKGLNPKAYLAINDSYTLFKALDSLVVTGATHTNVNDFRAILIS